MADTIMSLKMIIGTQAVFGAIAFICIVGYILRSRWIRHKFESTLKEGETMRWDVGIILNDKNLLDGWIDEGRVCFIKNGKKQR